jgi:hypothetical protein
VDIHHNADLARLRVKAAAPAPPLPLAAFLDPRTSHPKAYILNELTAFLAHETARPSSSTASAQIPWSKVLANFTHWPLQVTVAAAEDLQSIDVLHLTPPPQPPAGRYPADPQPPVKYESVRLDPEHYATFLRPEPASDLAAVLLANKAAALERRAAKRALVQAFTSH